MHTALATGDYNQADQIHIKLMVDHISEVSEAGYILLYVSTHASFLKKLSSFGVMYINTVTCVHVVFISPESSLPSLIIVIVLACFGKI